VVKEFSAGRAEASDELADCFLVKARRAGRGPDRQAFRQKVQGELGVFDWQPHVAQGARLRRGLLDGQRGSAIEAANPAGSVAIAAVFLRIFVLAGGGDHSGLPLS
jgi:hypothetical protein